MKHDNNVLSFTVNESLYVEGMEGIEEMLAISLDPDIAIETFYEDVQIRGLIILQGEYKKSPDNQENTSLGNESHIQIMEKMIETEEDQVMFSHRFPVEVTVSENRITDINDVKVEVVAFDYEIPSNYRLNITAELHIHGILNENALRKVEEENEQNLTDDTERIESEEKQTNEKEQKGSQVKKEDNVKEETTTSENNSIIKTEDFEITEDSIEAKYKSENEKVVSHVEKLNEGEETIDIQLIENEEIEEQDEVEDVLFLTDLFADVQEESVSTMRIHIIQADDTIESVAKRYDMSALQLMKNNQLNADEMTPGKLIYIHTDK